MKCPHCHKLIRIKKDKEYDHPVFREKFIRLFIFNFMMYAVPFGFVVSWLDDHTSIPLSMKDGLSFNLGVSLILPIAIFVLIYLGLYRYKKLKGRFLFKNE